MSENTKNSVSSSNESKKSISETLAPVKTYVPSNTRDYVLLAEGVLLALTGVAVKAMIDAKKAKKEATKK